MSCATISLSTASHALCNLFREEAPSSVQAKGMCRTPIVTTWVGLILVAASAQAGSLQIRLDRSWPFCRVESDNLFSC